MKRRGLTIAEVLVAAFITLLIMLVAESIMNYVQRVGLKARAQLEPRQQIRSALTQLAFDLRAGAYIYEGFSGTVLTTPVAVPSPGGSGSGLVFAVPVDQGGVLAYRVCAFFARPRSQPDPNNLAARELVYHSYEPQLTTPPQTPGALNPATCSGGTSKVFDSYLTPGATGLVIRLTPNGEAAEVSVSCTLKPLRGPTVTERFSTLVTMRNNV